MDKICAYCGKLLPSPESCTCRKVMIMEQRTRRIRYGEEEYTRRSSRCPCCGTYRGGYHHADCSIEECPICRDLVIHCNCVSDFIF